MKFALIIWVCSFVNQVCAPPINHNILYNSWNECVDSAYDFSIKFLNTQNVDEINKMKLATKFVCKEIESV
jgi:hypothetical protein